jgi:hypothetical protein
MFIPLELSLRPSRIHAGLMLLGHVLALIAITQAALPLWLQGLLVAGVLAGLARGWRRRSTGAAGLRLAQGGQLRLKLHDWQSAEMTGQPVVLPWLVNIRLALSDGRQVRLLLWPDSADADALRKLRAWLRWGYRPPSGKGSA